MFKEKNQIDEKIKSAKQIDIKSYLQQRGFTFNAQNFCSSPFSRDSNWSFKYYPNTNTFFDWSKGFGGDSIKLVMVMENVGFLDAVDLLMQGQYQVYRPDYKKADKVIEEKFDVEKYITEDERECALIDEYARSRGIKRGFSYGVFFTRPSSDAVWTRNPALAFPLRDTNLKFTGIKFRRLPQGNQHRDGTKGDRFSSRGRQGFYILENIISGSYEEPVLFLIESETSANSLWEYCCEIKKSAVVISFGSVGSKFDELPKPYQNLRNKRLIIDYDGNEELYQQRVKNFAHIDAKPLKLILPKGEDINSLYSSNQMFKISNLLFNE